MELIILKLLLILNGWVVAEGSPVAMLQHATSSQSFVFHSGQSESSTNIPTSPAADRHNQRQPNYEYKYEVSDHQTGDRKSHWESRDGDKVRGVYTLYEPDGALRTVEYTADAIHGFNAVVKRNEPTKHQYSGRTTPFDRSSSPDIQKDRNAPYIPNPTQKTFNANRNKDSSFQGPNSYYNNPEVEFSVNHVLTKFEDSTGHF